MRSNYLIWSTTCVQCNRNYFEIWSLFGLLQMLDRGKDFFNWKSLQNFYGDRWVKVFKNRPSKICGRQPLKKLKWFNLPKQTVFRKFYLVHSWMPWPIWSLAVCMIFLRTINFLENVTTIFVVLSTEIFVKLQDEQFKILQKYQLKKYLSNHTLAMTNYTYSNKMRVR